jgi:hypothetical protein
VMRTLANDRALPAHTSLDSRARPVFYQWYCAGYLDIAGAPGIAGAKRRRNPLRR